MPRGRQSGELPGRALARLRDLKQWTQKELARRLGVNQSRIAQWEAGERIPYAQAAKLAELFGEFTDTFTDDLEPRIDRTIAVIWAHKKEDWQDAFRHTLETALLHAGFAFQPFVPDFNFDWPDHKRLQQDFLRQKKHYAACINVIPVWGLEKVQEFNAFADEFSRPVLFLDQDIGVHASRLSRFAHFMSFDDRVGGRLAAAAVAPLLDGAGSGAVVGAFGPVKHPRYDSFRDALQSHIPGIEFVLRTEAEFARGKSADFFRDFLRHRIIKAKLPRLIYCGSDSIALGAHDAVEECLMASKRRKSWRTTGPTPPLSCLRRGKF